MSNGTHTAPRVVWLPPRPEPPSQPDKSERRSTGSVELGLFIATAATMALLALALKFEDVGRFTGLIAGSFAELPEHGTLLFFGSALVGLAIWARRRSH